MDSGRGQGIDFRAELNDEQYAAVTAPPGPALVLAGAGSGKTRTLTYRVAYLREQGVAPWEILLLTFTNKAAREMLMRVEGLTGGRYSSEWGGTFHSIGARVLRRHGEAIGLQPGFTIMDEGDANSLFNEVVKASDPSFTKNKDNPTPKVIHGLISYARNTRRPIESVVDERFRNPKIIHPIGGFARAYQKAKLERQVTDYDDLLEHWLELLKKDDKVRERFQKQFRHILVDEYQDTNLLQSEIVDLIAGDHQVMAVGDDAQCIYTWRGANFENIASFEKRHPGAKIYKIQVNYRSTPPILAFANEVLRDPGFSGFAYHKELHAWRDGNLKPYIAPCIDTVAQARFVIDRVRGLYNEGKALSDICVLYRSHFQAMDLQTELSREGIPYTITSGVRFFEQAHIRDFVAQLRFVSNPADTTAFERFASLLPKIGPKAAQKIHGAIMDLVARNVEENMKRQAVKKKPAPRLRELTLFDMGDDEPAGEPPARTVSQTLLPTHPCALMGDEKVLAKAPADAKEHWEQLAATFADAAELLAAPGGEVSPASVVKVLLEGWYGDYIHNAYEHSASRREDLDALINFASQYPTLGEMLAQLILLSSETAEKSIEAGQDSLRLSTIHQSKGLEYPAVFVIGLSEGSFPLQRAIEEGDVDEERRLFYVAVTRAEDELYLLYPQLQRAKGTLLRCDPSQFLRAIPGDCYEIVRPRRTAW